MRNRTASLIGVLALGATSLGGTGAALAADPVRPLPVNATADYQLSGAYPPAAGVGVVSRDWRDRPAPGTYGICYINGFQTQPERRKWWRTNHADLLLRKASGRVVGDPNWPGEFLVDTSKRWKRRALARISGRWIRACDRRGFDAVEPDNLDSWTRSNGLLKRRDNARLARSLVRRAHRRGLAVAQKNDVDMLPRRHRIGFDFAVVEECQVYRECGRFVRAYDRRVIEIEYSDSGGSANFRRACEARGSLISIIYRDRHLSSPGDPTYRFATC